MKTNKKPARNILDIASELYAAKERLETHESHPDAHADSTIAIRKRTVARLSSEEGLYVYSPGEKTWGMPVNWHLLVDVETWEKLENGSHVPVKFSGSRGFRLLSHVEYDRMYYRGEIRLRTHRR